MGSVRGRDEWRCVWMTTGAQSAMMAEIQMRLVCGKLGYARTGAMSMEG